jgi:hypothetical protein
VRFGRDRAVKIDFEIAGRPGRVDAHHPLWSQALPMPSRFRPAAPEQTIAISHGAYFESIQTYLEADGGRPLRMALEALAPSAPRPALRQPINVILEKHGEFYHPARIQVASGEKPHVLALNVAVTPPGIECMQNELEALDRVAPRLPAGTLPRVFDAGRSETPDGLSVQMFLADWFEDHHEFHLSVDPQDGVQKTIVWDRRRGPYFLPPHLMADIYFQAAFLLSRAYDPRSTRQIYPWHHAAGDFVLRRDADELHLKLITVRQYAPTMAPEDGQDLDDDARLMALMVFVANLSLRNRLDRMDGTGEMAWADDAAVSATVAGFKKALEGSLSTDLVNLLRNYAEDDWMVLLDAVGARYRLMPAEEDLLKPRIAAHAVCLQAAIRNAFPI